MFLNLFFIAKATAFVNGTLPTNDFRTPLDQRQQRRATERDARRYLTFVKITKFKNNYNCYFSVYAEEKIVNYHLYNILMECPLMMKKINQISIYFSNKNVKRNENFIAELFSFSL